MCVLPAWQFAAMHNVNALILSLHAAENGAAPEWLHLLPATSFKGVDGRGPYAAPDMAALISTFQKDGRKLPVDENHAIDLAGKAGLPSPARGWIVELQARDDGLWGRVEWTEEGAALVAGKSYGYLSPVFLHSKGAPVVISKVLRVALTNDPNLDFLTSLHSKQETAMLEKLRATLGLPETATEAEILAAVASAHSAQQAGVALMSRLTEATGLAATSDAEAIVTAVQARGKTTATEAENAELRSQFVALNNRFTELVTTTARDKAVTTIDGAITAGKVVPALRDHMISRHMKNPAEVEAEIKLMPSINAGGLGGRQLPENGGTVLAPEADQVMAQMGLDPKAFGEHHKALHGKDS